jgi:hypothetical protein
VKQTHQLLKQHIFQNAIGDLPAPAWSASADPKEADKIMF